MYIEKINGPEDVKKLTDRTALCIRVTKRQDCI